jgi:hypothetical protein
VYTGDALRICIVTKEGIREETVPLRKDWYVDLTLELLDEFVLLKKNPEVLISF